ncbi:uncharacterized protein LOC121725559 [Aricia agestis]|uniref:uncharacterized protein LOC121725559 n=1 Tax=Aricia agestis TaxID=91739 RepID=UPI001C205392|nr:uncharacterized protein LOC121725559 [Aricia agestis]
MSAISTRSLKNSGNEDISKIMNHLLNHPEDLNKVKACLNNDKVKSDTYSPDKALALLVSLKLSKWQYINLRESASENGSELYPSYYKLQQAKLNCYPDKKDLCITEDGASIKLQALLNLTVSRLLDAISMDLDATINLELVSKWGFDGASGQSVYKQKVNKEFEDSSIFMASLVPVRLQQSDGTIVWENERPSSTFYCCPLMFQFTKETQSTVMSIKNRITEEIKALQPSKLNQIEVSHQLLLTMIDGKITSYLSETSTAVCDICKAKPSEMNNIELLDQKHNNEEIHQYGLSSLHCWIRCMECLLHIAYRMDFKKWSGRGEDQQKIKLRKFEIQRAFREDCGLLIDQVKQGEGTTNDGNTARRFFRDADTAARITGISKELIERLHVILQTVASGECVNLSKFSLFCRETAELYINLYPWYYMPSSLHKLLIHGADIIQHFATIPIGNLSEEAAEARNKDFRKFRESYSRKLSRKATNEDILHNLLISSDPNITSFRPRLSKHNKIALSSRAKELLLNLPTESEIEFIDVNELQDNHSDSE